MEFDQVRNQFFGKDQLPPIKVFAIIQVEESRRTLMIEQSVTDGLTMVTARGG